MKEIWLTRPREDSKRMANLLSEQQIPSLIAPVMEISASAVVWPSQKPDALLVTSRYAAATLGSMPKEWRDLPTYCVGIGTHKIAREQGMSNIITSEANALDLLPKIKMQMMPGQRLLYPSGEDIKIDVAPLLATRQITVDRVIAYKAVATPALPETVANKLISGQLQGVILCSPRAVRITYDLLDAANLLPHMHALDVYCLSMNIATHAASLGSNRLLTTPVPTYEAMMELLLSHAQRS